jgi:hypothetical protein
MKTLTAGVTFMAVAVISATLAGLGWGGLTSTSAILCLLIALIAGIVAGTRVESRMPSKWGFWDWTVMIIFALVCLRAFIWLLYPVGDDWFVLSPNNLGDLSLHISFIRYLASGVGFWPESPIFAGTPLVYPPGVDLLNSLLSLISLDLRVGLILVGLGASVLAALALRLWGGTFAVAAFLFGGGLVGFDIFTTGQFIDYQAEGIWKNAFLALFVTQRGLLYALPAGLLLLSAWREEYFANKRSLPFALQWLIYATMPLFHVHSFLFLSVILAGIFIGVPRYRKTAVILAALSFLPATACVYLVTGGFSAASGISLAPDWMYATAKGWVPLLEDFGVAPLLGVITLVLAIKARSREAISFLSAGVFVFLVCCFVAFSKWPWDNTKLMLWSWLVFAPYLWQFVLRPLPVPAQTAICVLIFFTGVISLAAGLDTRHGYSIAKRSELAAWEVALRDIPQDATFAAVPTYNHPLLLLGRKVLCGYDGHLYSHGINYLNRYRRVQILMEKPPGWEMELLTLGATHAGFRADESGSNELQIVPLAKALQEQATPSPANR